MEKIQTTQVSDNYYPVAVNHDDSRTKIAVTGMHCATAIVIMFMVVYNGYHGKLVIKPDKIKVAFSNSSVPVAA